MVKGIDIGTSGVLADLARINIKYLLEHYYNGELQKAIALPLPPKALSVIQEAPHNITYSLSGQAIRELGTYKRRTITLNGSSGYDARQGYDRSGGVILNTGAVILREFRAFLEEYQEKAESATQDEEGDPLHQLVFRAIDEDYHFLVEVSSFEVQRDSQGSHFASDWNLTLNAYDETERVLAFQNIQDPINQIRSSIENINNTLAVVSLSVEGTLGLTNLILSPLDSLKQSVQAYDGVTQSLRNVLDLPSDIIGRLEQTALVFRTANQRLLNDINRFPNTLSTRFKALKRALFGAEELQSEAESLAVFNQPVETEELNSNLYLSRGSTLESLESTRIATTTYRLRLGEDLTYLARRYLGDADRWVELAELNGWLNAYQLGNGRPADVGDPVLIPAVINPVETNKVFIEAGEDLFLSEDGNLVILNNDLLTIKGASNIEQGIKLRLKAVQNETPIFKSYGLPNVIGRRLTANMAGYLGALVREQISQDLRVESVLFLEFIDRGDTLVANIEIRTNEISNIGVEISL